MEKLLLTIPEAAEMIGIKRSKFYLLINEGEIPVVKIGRATRVSAARLREWAAKLGD